MDKLNCIYGKAITPLNITSDDVNILDMIHCLCFQPMFGGMTRSFYSKAEHLCNMLDLYLESPNTQISKYYPNINCAIYSINQKEILKYILMYFAGHSFLLSKIGAFVAWEHHNPRVIGAFLSSLGEDYSNYKKCLLLIEGLDEQMQEIIDLKNTKTLTPYQAMEKFIKYFNKVYEIQITTLGKDLFEYNYNEESNFNKLPRIRIY